MNFKIGDIVTTLYERLNTGQRGIYTNILWPYTYILKFRSVDQGYVVKTERWKVMLLKQKDEHAAMILQLLKYPSTWISYILYLHVIIIIIIIIISIIIIIINYYY